MMTYIEAPKRNFTKDKKSLFLAGGITDCPDWQRTIINSLNDLDVTIFNPRRKNFPINDPNAAQEQITWEFDMLRQADIIIVFWFCSETMCPIVLYELGAHSMTNKPIIIGLDPNYSRRQDVEIQTKLQRPDVKIVYSLDDLTKSIRAQITNKISSISTMKHLTVINTEFLKFSSYNK